jgi:hypothetical protein
LKRLKKNLEKFLQVQEKLLTLQSQIERAARRQRRARLEEDGSLNYESTNSPGFRQGRPATLRSVGAKKIHTMESLILAQDER